MKGSAESGILGPKLNTRKLTKKLRTGLSLKQNFNFLKMPVSNELTCWNVVLKLNKFKVCF